MDVTTRHDGEAISCCLLPLMHHAHSCGSDQSHEGADRQSQTLVSAASYKRIRAVSAAFTLSLRRHDNNERCISSPAGDVPPSSQGAARTAVSAADRTQSASYQLRTVCNDGWRQWRSGVPTRTTETFLDFTDDTRWPRQAVRCRRCRYEQLRRRRCVPWLPRCADSSQQRWQQHVSSHWLPQCTSRCVPCKSPDRCIDACISNCILDYHTLSFLSGSLIRGKQNICNILELSFY